MTGVDLLVAGGGPAGLATALHARRAGLSVEVWDRRAGVVDKACGEGLMPGAVAALRALGADPPGWTLHGIRYLDARGSVEAPFRHGSGRGVRRTVLHAALRDAVDAAGIEVAHRRVGDVRQDATGVTVVDEAGTTQLRATHLVAADGLHSPLRRRLGLEGRPAGLRRFGVRRHYAVPPWTSYVEVHWGPTGEAYVTPVGPGTVGVAMLSTAKGGFDDHLAGFPRLLRRLGGCPVDGPDRGAGPLRQRAAARVAGRVLLVGDAAGYVDALTGEGVALALAQARVAVAAIVAGDPARYDRDWRRVTRRYRLLTAGLVEATRLPPIRRGLVPAARLLPGAFTAAVDALARPA